MIGSTGFNALEPVYLEANFLAFMHRQGADTRGICINGSIGLTGTQWLFVRPDFCLYSIDKSPFIATYVAKCLSQYHLVLAPRRGALLVRRWQGGRHGRRFQWPENVQSHFPAIRLPLLLEMLWTKFPTNSSIKTQYLFRCLSLYRPKMAILQVCIWSCDLEVDLECYHWQSSSPMRWPRYQQPYL